VGSGWGTTFSAITGTGNVTVDSAAVATLARVQKKVDSLNATIATKGSGTVTSVATDATLTGGTITTTGTLGINLTNANSWTGKQTMSANGLHATTTPLISMANATAATSVNLYEVSPSINMPATYFSGGISNPSIISIFNNPNSSNLTGEFSVWGQLGGAAVRLMWINMSGSFSMGGGTFNGSVTCTSNLGVTGTLSANGGATFAVNKKITYTTGTNGCSGTATLVAGTVTVSTTCTPTAGQILLTPESAGTPCATCGNLSQGTLTGGVSFIIWSSLNTDTRLVHWTIVGN
jgi:hypothetical protein